MLFDLSLTFGASQKMLSFPSCLLIDRSRSENQKSIITNRCMMVMVDADADDNVNKYILFFIIFIGA